MSEAAKYIDFYKGWLAFKHGKVVRTKDRRIKVFQSEASAMKAAKQSKMQFGVL